MTRLSDSKLAVAVAMTILIAVPGCAARAPAAVRAGGASFTQIIDLPAPATNGAMSLEQALARRRSVRQFAADPLPLSYIGQLFWSAQGITSPDGKRAAPSAGGLYPLELYALTDEDVLHYLPEGHRAEARPARRWRDALQRAAFGQEVAAGAPAVIIVTADPARTEAKYGPLAADFVQREAGHATENLLLQATALGIAAVPVGGIDAAAVAEILALPPNMIVVYIIPVGHPIG